MIDVLYVPAILFLALILDRLIGEVPRFHPLVGFGRLAQCIEGWLGDKNTDDTTCTSVLIRRVKGVLAWVICVVPLPLVLWLSAASGVVGAFIDVLCVYFAVGLRSLTLHASQVAAPLASNNLNEARRLTSYLVSRDTQNLSAQAITRATVESTLENGNDAVFASLFYFAIGGAPLVIMHRLINTLDAMWGYKSPRYLHFGWWAARCDDVFAYPTAWLSALLYLLQASSYTLSARSWRLLYVQSAQYKSRNGGLVMAAGAMALGRHVGGTSVYHGQLYQGTILGLGPRVRVHDIYRSVNLVSRGAYLFVFGLLLVGVLIILYREVG